MIIVANNLSIKRSRKVIINEVHFLPFEDTIKRLATRSQVPSASYIHQENLSDFDRTGTTTTISTILFAVRCT